MGRGRTKSKLTLSERRERAIELIGRGYSNTDIARELGVTRQTAASYRKAHDERIAQKAQESPDLLRDHLGNTIRQLDTYDDMIQLAWKKLQRRKKTVSVECPECGASDKLVYQEPPSDQATSQYMSQIIKAQDSKSKLLGLLGVKQELVIEVQNVNIVQQKVLGWMQKNLPFDMQQRLANWMETELAPYIASSPDEIRPVLPASVLAETTVERSSLDDV